MSESLNKSEKDSYKTMFNYYDLYENQILIKDPSTFEKLNSSKSLYINFA